MRQIFVGSFPTIYYHQLQDMFLNSSANNTYNRTNLNVCGKVGFVKKFQCINCNSPAQSKTSDWFFPASVFPLGKLMVLAA